MQRLAAVLITCVFTATAAEAQQSQADTYDVQGRLTAVKRTTGSNAQTTSYSLSKSDNRTSRATSAASSSSSIALMRFDDGSIGDGSETDIDEATSTDARADDITPDKT